MKIFTPTSLYTKSLLFSALLLTTFAKLPAVVNDYCKLAGIVGTHTVVRVQKRLVTGTVDTLLIGTDGNDQQYIDTMQFGLFDNATTTIQVLTITAPWYDSNMDFLLKHERLNNKYIFLQLLTDTGTNGALLSQPRILQEGDILRITSGQVIEDEIHLLTILIRDYQGNSAEGGTYSTTIYLNFSTQT